MINLRQKATTNINRVGPTSADADTLLMLKSFGQSTNGYAARKAAAMCDESRHCIRSAVRIDRQMSPSSPLPNATETALRRLFPSPKSAMDRIACSEAIDIHNPNRSAPRCRNINGMVIRLVIPTSPLAATLDNPVMAVRRLLPAGIFRFMPSEPACG